MSTLLRTPTCLALRGPQQPRSQVFKPTSAFKSGQAGQYSFLARQTKPRQVASFRVYARDVEKEAEGFLAHKGQQKLGYQVLALLWSAAAIAGVFFTPQYLEWTLGSGAGAALALNQRIVAAAHIPIATALYSLQAAAQARRLDRDTYKRLNLGLVSSGVLLLIFTWKMPNILSQAYQRAVLSVAAATAAVCGIIYHQVSGFDISRIVDGVADSAKNLGKWDNSKGLMYAVLTAGFSFYSAVTLFGAYGAVSKWVGIAGGEATNVLTRQLGALLVTSAAILYNLKNAADRGRLGGSTFKNLNLGVASFGAAALTATLYVYQFSQQLAWSKPLLVRTVILGLAALTCLAGYTDAGEDDRASNPLSNVAGKFEDALDGGVDNLKHVLDRGEDKVDEAGNKADKYGKKAERKAEDAESEGKGLVDKVTNKAEKAGDKVQNKAEKAGKDIKKGAKDVERDLD
eukprot:jgi/Astpho2/7681/Aster-02563